MSVQHARCRRSEISQPFTRALHRRHSHSTLRGKERAVPGRQLPPRADHAPRPSLPMHRKCVPMQRVRGQPSARCPGAPQFVHRCSSIQPPGEASWVAGGLGCVAERGGLGCVAVLLRQLFLFVEVPCNSVLQSCHQRRMCLDRGGDTPKRPFGTQSVAFWCVGSN